MDSEIEATDETGDGCDYYVGKESECGKYDTEEFKANTMCCACKGNFKGINIQVYFRYKIEFKEFLWHKWYSQNCTTRFSKM